MSNDSFMIAIDLLKNGVVQKMNLALSPSFFEINEPDLSFEDPVSVSGEAYLTDDEFILHFSAQTMARMPCSICNRMTPISLFTKSYYHTEPLTSIESLQFDPRPIFREALLIELPKAAECTNGCPERASIAPYLSKEKKTSTTEDGHNYFPFSDLDYPKE